MGAASRLKDARIDYYPRPRRVIKLDTPRTEFTAINAINDTSKIPIGLSPHDKHRHGRFQ
jgi:hypothetical protein